MVLNLNSLEVIMLHMPESEKDRFKSALNVQAKLFALTPEEYLRKIWYHEQTSKIGEYTALALTEDLVSLAPQQSDGEVKDEQGG